MPFYTQEGEDVSLRIPNREVAGIFQEEVMAAFSRTADEARVRALVEALWEGDQAAASDALSDLLWDTISYMDYSEDYYHAFLAGIFVGFGYVVAFSGRAFWSASCKHLSETNRPVESASFWTLARRAGYL